ncbi:MAG: hypothetical protein MPJ78_03185 [Hyphomicrobiaceae bacterium]|nr:hypothetical protein [Hyphomicrobiaceae bacterium]
MSFQEPSSTHAAFAQPTSDQAVQAIFFVTATADPGMVQRLVEPFSKLGLVPARVHISSEDGRGEELSADLRVAGLTQQTAHLVDKALRRIVGVRQVITLAE